MIFVKAYEISRLAIIFLAFLASYARRRKEKMMQPTNNHFPVLKGIAMQLSILAQFLKISFDQFLVVNMVMAEKISEM